MFHERVTRMVSRTHYFYTVTLSFFCGVALSSSAFVGYGEGLLACVVAVGAAMLFYTSGRRHLHLAVALVCIGIALGICRFEFSEGQVSHALDAFENHHVLLEGVVVREPSRRENTTQLVVRVDKADAAALKGTVLVLHDRLSEVAYGDRVEVEGVLALPATFDTDMGRQFRYREYLLAQGVDHTMTYPTVRVLARGEGWQFVTLLLNFKQSLSASIATALRAPEAGLALGVLLGEKQALGKELLTVFQNAGLIHIVVLSGYNIAIMIEACMWLLRGLSTRARSVSGGGTIFCFVMMVGPSATVLRAAIMAGLVLLARATGKTYAILRALVLAGVGMVMVNPYLLMYDPGFQLSFLATVGLVALVPLFERAVPWIPSTMGIKDFFFATVAAQVMTLPLVMYAMGTVSVFAVIANVVVLPVIPLAMLLTAVTGFAGMLSGSAAIVAGYPAYLTLHYVMVVSDLFGTMSYGVWVLPPFSFLWVIALYIAIGASIGMAMGYTKSPPKLAASMDTPMPF